MSKKKALNELNELHKLVAMRVVIGHWPDADYIMRGIAVTYGDEAAVGVREILEARRVGFARELKALERKHASAATHELERKSLTGAVTNRHDSAAGEQPGGKRDQSGEGARRPKAAGEDRAQEVHDAGRPARQA